MLLKNILIAVLSLMCIGLTAQEPVRFVDFHSHPAMKNYYRNVPSFRNMGDPAFVQTIKTLNWSDLRNQRMKDTLNFSGITRKMSYNQATYDLLNKGNASIICASIYALEKQSISNKFIPWVPFTMRFINNHFVSALPNKRQRAAFRCTGYEEYQGQVKFLEAQNMFNSNFLKKVKIADNISDLNNPSVIALVLTAEGVHNFYGTYNDNLNEINDYKCGTACTEETIKNLRDAKNAHRLFFITPSHLFWGKVAGHARGLDIDNIAMRSMLAKMMWDKKFRVVDGKDAEGIITEVKRNKKYLDQDSCNCSYDTTVPTEYVIFGKLFLEAMLDSSDNKYHKPTLIDMRHMDVKARSEIIQFCKNYGIQHKTNVPLIVSHSAVNGKNEKKAKYLGLCPRNDDYNEIMDPVKYYKSLIQSCGSEIEMHTDTDVDNFMKTAGWFHPMSNNLYDEEIVAVYASKGMIGITMEERALGKNTYNYRNQKPEDGIVSFAKKYLNKPIAESLAKDFETAEPFVRNLFYIVEHSGVAGIERWKHVGLGTDFDGIMNPIDICPTSAHIPKFFNFLVAHLDMYAAYLGKQSLLGDASNEELLRMVFYKNGEQFIKANF